MSAAINLARRFLARGAAGIGHDTPRIGPADLAAWLTEGRAVRRPVVRAVALVVGIMPFAAYATLILYHFYLKGGFLWDSGLLAFLIGASDPRLPVPPIMGDGSFFAIHVTPIFVALSPIRSLLPMTGPQFFALFSGACHALPGLAVFWVLYSGYRLRTPLGVGVAAVLGLAFSFNGLALAIARYPHFEMLIVGMALLFFVALAQGRRAAAVVFFAICLATREDAGFHLFAILCLLIALNRWRGIAWHEQRHEIVFALLALSYSVGALSLQHALFDHESSFARIYLGEPAFGKISLALLRDRLLGYLQYRTYIVLPGLIALFWAVRAGNPYLVLGYAAFLPWAVLHLMAESDIAGTLSGYYAYPFMIASFWPLLAALVERRQRAVPNAAVPAVFGFAAMIGASFTALGYQANLGHIELPAGFWSLPSLARQAATDNALGQIVRGKAALGSVMVDGSVLGLVSDGFSKTETVRESGGRSPDTVVYFADAFESEAAQALAAKAGLDHRYEARGTAIRLWTRGAIDPASPLGSVLAPAATSE
ncbi:MAG TPA: hypothetical protein VGN21_09850 [Stellaceae bacterium]